ncbi:hypothetical protein N7474_009271 [Penicillium riverlandense]|uniref:uncharacterized protein n=1 Tax=Penicillium riverlandense TaxID=1903569 RepID=UPI0025472DE9|nr:uncharacterized protein N7474_009271 [Penicillium riverlandense]KAJ5808002.1 hypothetical protein N7474_009271 [Penicillium riverlandense]
MVKTRICIISDTHTCAPHAPLNTSNPYRQPLPKADILLHAGDITKVGYHVEHEQMVAMLKEADAELKLVIAGNHDMTLDEEYFTSYGWRRHQRPEWLGGQGILPDEDPRSTIRMKNDVPPSEEALKAYVQRAKDLYTNASAQAAGIRYLDEGTYTFTLSNGATFTVYASPYQPEFCRWAFAYPREQDRFNPPLDPGSAQQPANPVPNHPAVDMMITHGPPLGIFDEVAHGARVGCPHLLRAAERARPRLHVFGHIHEGYGAARGTWDAFAEGGVRLEDVKTDPEDVLERRGAFCDLSTEGGSHLGLGRRRSLLTQASIRCGINREMRRGLSIWIYPSLGRDR